MSFDKDVALDSAMTLFWHKGYEATSMADLTEAMGITPPSLYNAFGGKEQLFLTALQRYLDVIGAASQVKLDSAPTARDAMCQLLENVARNDVRDGRPRGCLLVASSAAGSAAPAAAQSFLQRALSSYEAQLRERIERGQREGDVPATVNAADLASFYHCTINGMSTLARGGATCDRLLAICATAMQAWPAG